MRSASKACLCKSQISAPPTPARANPIRHSCRVLHSSALGSERARQSLSSERFTQFWSSDGTRAGKLVWGGPGLLGRWKRGWPRPLLLLEAQGADGGHIHVERVRYQSLFSEPEKLRRERFGDGANAHAMRAARSAGPVPGVWLREGGS